MQLNIWRRGLAQERRWKSGCRFVAICSTPSSCRSGNRSGDDADRTTMAGDYRRGLGAQYGDAVPLSLLRDELASVWIKNVSASVFSPDRLTFDSDANAFNSVQSGLPAGNERGVYPRQLAPLGFDLMSQKPNVATVAVAMTTATCSWKR